MGTNSNTTSLGEPYRREITGTASDLVIGGVARKVAIQTDSNEESMTITAGFIRAAINQLVANIMVVGTSQKQISKITSLLILAKHSNIQQQERERYFYQAVTLAQRYLGTEPSDIKKWDDIVFTYLRYIHNTSNMSDGHFERYKNMYDICRDSLTLQNTERKNREIEAAKDTQTYLSGITDPPKILKKLEDLIGPVRLLIRSRESGEVLIQHNIDTADRDMVDNTHATIVKTFNREKGYSVSIDYGSIEINNQIRETDWNDYIKPIIDIYIEKMESLFSQSQHGNLRAIEQREANRGAEILSLEIDYTILLSRVINSIDPRLNTDANYIQDCIRAIDICRLITLRHSNSTIKNSPGIPRFDIENIHQELDHILEGRITRRVFRMVTTMLISRDETMNGLGYPSGLNKDNIHILGKVLSIIRAYESICLDMIPGCAIELMSYGSRGGYWDSDVLDIFVDTLRDGKIGTRPQNQKKSHTKKQGNQSITPYRRRVYDPYIQSWENLVSTIADLEGQYALLRDPKTHATMRCAILLTISELESELRTELETKMLIIIRHAETESDKKGGKKPGAIDEGVTKKGIQASRKIGKGFKRLKLDIRTSETERGRVTAKLLCESSQHCVEHCLGCDSPIIEESALRNRTKDEENEYGDSFLGKVIATHPRELQQLLNKICFSTKHSQVLLISHADTIKALKVLLENMGHKNLIHSERTSIKNGTTLTYLVQGGNIITANLFLSIKNWIPVTRRVNSIIREVFGERKLLYPRDMSNVDIFDLHGQFLDYIDEKIENQPNKTKEFIQALDNDPLTAHFSQVLRMEGKIS